MTHEVVRVFSTRGGYQTVQVFLHPYPTAADNGAYVKYLILNHSTLEQALADAILRRSGLTDDLSAQLVAETLLGRMRWELEDLVDLVRRAQHDLSIVVEYHPFA